MRYKHKFSIFKLLGHLGLLVIIAGCAPKRLKKVTLSHVSEQETKEDDSSTQPLKKEKELFSQWEAKLSDIPFLGLLGIDSEVCNTPETDNGTVIMRFNSSISSDLITIYKHEMERLGWDARFTAVGNESLLMFEKPSRWCAVSIRPTDNYNQVIIFTGQKGLVFSDQ